MSRPIEYKILYSEQAYLLQQEVQEYIETGWEPHGSLVIEMASETLSTYFYQPIIRMAGRS